MRHYALRYMRTKTEPRSSTISLQHTSHNFTIRRSMKYLIVWMIGRPGIVPLSATGRQLGADACNVLDRARADHHQALSDHQPDRNSWQQSAASMTSCQDRLPSPER